MTLKDQEWINHLETRKEGRNPGEFQTLISLHFQKKPLVKITLKESVLDMGFAMKGIVSSLFISVAGYSPAENMVSQK